MAHRFRPYVYCDDCEFMSYTFSAYSDGQDCPECDDGTVLLAAPA